MLKVKEGFHHDLNANAIDELRGPILPWKKDINYLMLQYIATSTKFSDDLLPSTRSSCWPAMMQQLEM